MFPEPPSFSLHMPSFINVEDSAGVHGRNEDVAVHDFDGGTFGLPNFEITLEANIPHAITWLVKVVLAICPLRNIFNEYDHTHVSPYPFVSLI